MGLRCTVSPGYVGATVGYTMKQWQLGRNLYETKKKFNKEILENYFVTGDIGT